MSPAGGSTPESPAVSGPAPERDAEGPLRPAKKRVPRPAAAERPDGEFVATATAPAADVVSLLADVASRVGSLGKDDYNEQQGFAFRSIEAVKARVGPLLSAAGVVYGARILSMTVDTVLRGRNQVPYQRITATVRYRFKGPAGDWFDTEVIAVGEDGMDKAGGKVMTGAEKTALLQVLKIADAGDDPDKGRTVEEAVSPGGAPPSRPGEPAPPREPVPSRGSGPPAARSKAEADMRALLGDVSQSIAAQVRAEFVGRFATNLSGLAVDRHAEALTWMQERVVELMPAEPAAVADDS